MKGIDPQLRMLHIYTEKDARPIWQPQQRLNLHLNDTVKEELQKMLDANFIYPISDSKCVSPLVVVPRKNGNWCIYVDYRGYNQIQISPKYQDKTTFTYLWGRFSYRMLPFGLSNTPATFQRAILNIFADLINEGLEVYMDDFTPYGDDFDQALQTLEKVLE
eukprot:PITA_04096